MHNYIELKKNLREKLNPEFKAVVKRVRESLAALQRKLDEEDEQSRDFPSMIDEYYPAVLELITTLLKEPDRIAKNFSLEEHLLHKDYYRDQLGPFLWPAPLHSRALAKPLGYAGDYVMMNMLYDDHPFHGPSSFYKLVHAVSCRSISGRAVAARVPFLTQKIREKAQQAVFQNKACHIMSLGSGPAKEIQNFIEINPEWRHCEIHLVDQDAQAIGYCKSALEKIKQDEKSFIKLFYHNVSVKDMPDLVQALPKFNLIYSSGLFDYLSDDLFQMVLTFLHGLLQENGVLVIGNFSPEAYAKTGLWYLDDWPLVYRTSEELVKLVPPSLKSQRVAVETEETGVNLFLVVKK